MDHEKIFFALSNWGEFGQIRYRGTLKASEQRRITLNVPAGRKWVIFKYRCGDMIANSVYFSFDNIVNYFEQIILIRTE